MMEPQVSCYLLIHTVHASCVCMLICLSELLQMYTNCMLFNMWLWCCHGATE